MAVIVRSETLHFFLNSRHVAEKAQLSTEIPSSSGSQREETAEEVILQRLLRQMKLTVFALQAFLQHRQFITIKKSIFYIDLHSSKPNEPRQRHFSVSPSFCQMIWENILNNKIKQSVVHLKSKAQRNVPTLIWHLTVAVQEGQVVSGRERTIQIIFIILVLIIFFSNIYFWWGQNSLLSGAEQQLMI